MTWVFVFVVATLVECWFDPIRDAERTERFWRWHLRKWGSFYPLKAAVWVFVWTHVGGFWWAIGAAALFPALALLVWQASKERTRGAHWPVLYGVRKFLGLIE